MQNAVQNYWNAVLHWVFKILLWKVLLTACTFLYQEADQIWKWHSMLNAAFFLSHLYFHFLMHFFMGIRRCGCMAWQLHAKDLYSTKLDQWTMNHYSLEIGAVWNAVWSGVGVPRRQKLPKYSLRINRKPMIGASRIKWMTQRKCTTTYRTKEWK